MAAAADTAVAGMAAVGTVVDTAADTGAGTGVGMAGGVAAGAAAVAAAGVAAWAVAACPGAVVRPGAEGSAFRFDALAGRDIRSRQVRLPHARATKLIGKVPKGFCASQ